MLRRPLLLSIPVLLSACAAPMVPVGVVVPVARPSLELIGRNPVEVAALLGPPALDRSEGSARQLQFANAACVLDVVFYPDP